MITFSLQSGSNGNAIYVEAGDTKLLFDAGISGKQAELRMAAHGRDIRRCNALIISHDHSDHTRCAGIYQRKYRLPVHMTELTYRRVRGCIGPTQDVRRFVPGETMRFDDVLVHTIPTPHDAVEGACFVVEHEDRRLGIFTDLGHPFAALKQAIADVDAAYCESNYDPEMLKYGPYPPMLKRRIAGPGGHLSNQEAANLVASHTNGRLQWLAIAHLSEENNEIALALDAHRDASGKQLALKVASRYDVSDVFVVE